MEFIIDNISELDKVSKEIIKLTKKNNIVVFNGKMGAGKTTLIKNIAKKMGVIDNITSPTFSIINEYLTLKNETIFHFDFYRIEDIEEALDFGVEDYFLSKKICLIEWPQIIEPLLPDSIVKVNIDILNNKNRKIKIL